MTSQVAVISAAIFHYCIRFAVFITPYSDKTFDTECSRVGGFPALIILIGVCVFLTDNEVFSNEYSRYNLVIFRVIETVLTLLWIEFSMIMIWSRIESGIVALIKHILSRGNLYQEMGGDNFTALILSGASICFLMFAINISNSSNKFASILIQIYDGVVGYYNKLKAMRSNKKNGLCANATVFHCHPVEVQPCPITPARRNPSCPIHGDSEINSRGRRRK
jgi:hypothetical protein